MEHNLIAERFGVRLRPARLEDAHFIHKLRRTLELNKFIGDTDPQPEKQIEWLKQYFKRDGDYYFCIETVHGRPAGTISIYDISGNRGEWGRWVTVPGLHVSPGSVWLIYHIAFEVLHLQEIYCRTVEQNKQVVSFHDHCGLERSGIEINGACIRNKYVNLVVHTAKAQMWPFIQTKLEIAAKVAERFLLEGNK